MMPETVTCDGDDAVVMHYSTRPNPRPPIRTAQGKARCSGTLDDTPVEGARHQNMRAGTGPVAAWVPRPCQPTLQPGALRRIWLGPRKKQQVVLHTVTASERDRETTFSHGWPHYGTGNTAVPVLVQGKGEPYVVHNAFLKSWA